ncbi:MAG: ABC-ATPase domain-containing protein, partial [Geopsychrobacter sp.]|nr:ABC-ATPase domain-containing protein [Geopsychrobacter sp.]
MKRLQERLQTIIGKGYKAYKQLQGSYQFENFRLTFDHIQGDPYALSSRISISIEEADHGLPQALRSTAIRQIALEDFLARAVSQAIGQYVKGQRGTGHSGQIRIA